jgi:hypothetical protein
MTDENIDEWMNRQTYKSCHDMAKMSPEKLAETAAQLAIENDKLRFQLEHLKKYRSLVFLIATDYYELSYDKVMWQRDDWKKRAKKLIGEDIL